MIQSCKSSVHQIFTRSRSDVDPFAEPATGLDSIQRGGGAQLIGVVKQGSLTHNMSDCSIDGVYNAGDPVIESAGPDHVHLGRNLGSIPMILQVIYVDPVGKPLAEDAPNPGCDFS